jgi:non-specific serine/threonine protein kinase
MAFAKESLRLNRELGHLYGIAANLMSLARLTIWSGHLTLLTPWLEEALSIYRQLGDESGEPEVLTAYGDLAYWQGDYQKALERYEEAILLNDKVGYRYDNLWVHVFVAYTILRLGDIQQAYLMFQDCIRNMQNADMVIGLVYTIEGLASLHVNQGQFERAVPFFAWTDSMREQIGDQRPPIQQASVESDLAVIHSRLNHEEFAKFSAEGQTMTVEEAIALALEPVEEIPEIKFQSPAENIVPATFPSQREAEKQKYGGLTTREREVATQIAQGKSNQAIAAELFVGLKTVEAHVTRILSRLGFTSRAQIAGWAVSKGLAQAPRDLDTLGREDEWL